MDRSRPGLPDLIRSLASKAEAVEMNGGGHPVTDRCESEEILLDMDMDGARYLLLRMPVVDHAQVRLSPREREIVRMVAQGYPNKVIADVLNISTWTVCTHLRRIFAKAGVSSRAAMVARFFESRRGTADSPARSDNHRFQDGQSRRAAPHLAKLHPFEQGEGG
jgi:DNA-binding CsgD family transcriptional regulator